MGRSSYGGLDRPTTPSALTRSNRLITAEHHRTSIVQKRGQGHGKGNSRAYYVADHMIDARSQTGTAPDEQTAMRYPTRASELDHRRLQVRPLLCTIHHLINFTLVSVESVPVVFAVLDKGHQSKRTRQPPLGASVSGQGTKSLRSSPLRGGMSRRACS